MIVAFSSALRAALCDGGATTGCGETGRAGAGGKRAVAPTHRTTPASVGLYYP